MAVIPLLFSVGKVSGGGRRRDLRGSPAMVSAEHKRGVGPGVHARYSAARPGKGESPPLPPLGPFPKWNLCREARHSWPRCLSLICSAGRLVPVLSRSDPSPGSPQEQSQSSFPVNPPTPVGSQGGRPGERWPGPSWMVSRDEIMSEWQICWDRLKKPIPVSFREASVSNPVKIQILKPKGQAILCPP